jgi:hypothetical protein
MVRVPPDSPEGYLMWPLVDQLNKILEILGASITEINLLMISDENQALPTVTF